jgi:hypothetical protein
MTAGSGRGHMTITSRTPATRAGTAVSEQEDGRKASAGDVTADARERLDALLD